MKMNRKRNKRLRRIDLEDVQDIATIEENKTSTDESRVFIRQTTLYKLLEPLMVYVELSGLFHVRSANDTRYGLLGRINVRHGKWRKTILRCMYFVWRLWDIFPFTVIIGLLTMFLVALVGITFRMMKMEFLSLAMEMFLGLVCFQSAIYLISMYCNCENDSLLKLFQAYSLLAKNNVDERKRLDASVIRNMKIFMTVCIAVHFINVIIFDIFVHLSYNRQIDTGCFGSLLMDLLNFTPLFYYGYYLGSFFVIPPFTLCTGLFGIFCNILQEAFDAVTRELKANLEADEIHFKENPEHQSDFDVWPMFEEFRLITKMVDMASDIAGVYSLTYVFVNITLSCILTYMLMFSCPNTLSMVIMLGWAVCGCILTAFLLHCTSQVNNSVAAFLDRLSSNREVGISAFGFFTVTQKFILWVLSACVSYFFVLFSFKPSRDYCTMAKITCSRSTD